MKYCGVVTDKSWYDGKPGFTNCVHIVQNDFGFDWKRRIYSDEVPRPTERELANLRACLPIVWEG